MMTQFDKDKLAHDSLLRELHNIDGIAETFARTAILITAALFAFVSTIRTQEAIIVSSIVGILIGTIMIFKAHRHRIIFNYCYKRIKKCEKSLGVDAIRDFPTKKSFLRCFPPDGFTLLGWLGIGFLVAWGVVLGCSLRYGFLVASTLPTE